MGRIWPGKMWSLLRRGPRKYADVYHQLCRSASEALAGYASIIIVIIAVFSGIALLQALGCIAIIKCTFRPVGRRSGHEHTARRQSPVSRRPIRRCIPTQNGFGDTLFQQGGFFDPRDLVQVRYEMLRRHLVERQPVTEIIRDFGVSRQMFYVLAEDVSAGRVGWTVASQARPQGRPQMHRSDPRFRCCPPGGIARPIGQGVGRGCWQQIRRPVAPADPGTTSVAAGKKRRGKTSRSSSITGPSELVARYESIRQAAGNGPSLPSYELAVLLHQGVPGWLAFVAAAGGRLSAGVFAGRSERLVLLSK